MNDYAVIDFFRKALMEDLGVGGDITSDALVPADLRVSFGINTRDQIVVCGGMFVVKCLNEFGIGSVELSATDGSVVAAGNNILSGFGLARDILMLERTCLNIIQHLSGISTLTRQFVSAVSHTSVKISDTRKTIPGMRSLQKYAVVCGGGINHRFSLDSAILIKDNHISICGGVSDAIFVAKTRAPHYSKLIVECDTLEQVDECIKCGVDIVMLDNMSVELIKRAVDIVDGRAIIEASGGVSLSNVKSIAEAGVDYISVGRLTHSVRAADIGLDID
jgi:nicotinate-nucleotide pyrophosphorylase (carboxylating)